MKVNNINKNLSFNGYKNVISYTTELNKGDYFSYMGMKLDNEGEKDLDAWQEIQKNLFKIKKPSDYIVFNMLTTRDSQNFGVNQYLLDTENVKDAESERFMLKGFDLLASLTRRINCTDFPTEDSEIYKTIIEVRNTLINLLTDRKIAEELSMFGVRKLVKHYKTADLINKNIKKKMIRYFNL